MQRPCLSLQGGVGGGGGGGNSNKSKICVVLISIHGLLYDCQACTFFNTVHIYFVPVDVAVCILLPESAEQTNN
jgi:hypothetical protein